MLEANRFADAERVYREEIEDHPHNGWSLLGLIAALEALPERQRVAVMLIHSFGWSLSEVADHLGIAKGTVQTHLKRGMGALRRELGVNE